VAIVVGHHLLLAPAAITAGAATMALGLVLVWLAQQTAGACALRTCALMVRHPMDGCM
jgi:hypothetical protein